MTGIVLAGGKNSRISMKKAFIRMGHTTIIENTTLLLNQLFDEVIIVTNHPEDYRSLGTSLTSDVFPNKGPLGGIYSGLLRSTSEYNFIVACDMPFIDPLIVQHLKCHCNHHDYDVITAAYNGFIEPLFAIYSKTCIETIQTKLYKNQLKIRSFFTSLRVKEVDCQPFESAKHAFFNINTREDLQIAQRLKVG